MTRIIQERVSILGGCPMTYKITVEFCMMWNYAPKAARFAEQLFTHFRHNIAEMKLIPSGGGVFEVTVNEQKLYSKKETGIFPDVKDLIAKIESMA